MKHLIKGFIDDRNTPSYHRCYTGLPKKWKQFLFGDVAVTLADTFFAKAYLHGAIATILAGTFLTRGIPLGAISATLGDTIPARNSPFKLYQTFFGNFSGKKVVRDSPFWLYMTHWIKIFLQEVPLWGLR